MNIKKISFIVALILTLTANICVYAQETITLTTYYPSPFGQYDRLRLAPRAALPAADCNGFTVGLMYYDDALNSLRVCEDIGAGAQWGSVGGSGIWVRNAGLEDVYLQNINDFVGIGTNTPNEKLEVNGNIRLPLASAATGVIKLGPDRFLYSYGAFGQYNTFLGINAGNLVMAGRDNTGIGPNSLQNNTTGESNTAIGAGALRSNTTRHEHTAVGAGALASNTTGAFNTAVGRSALTSNTTGTTNTAVGIAALMRNTSGDHNVAIGGSSLYENTVGMDNTAVGQVALRRTTGSRNVGVGFGAGGLISDPAFNVTGSNNVFIGTRARPSDDNFINATAIGYQAVVGGSNKFVLGGTGANAVDVGIGTILPDATLHVVGDVKIVDGNQGSNKVLTSDAAGLATWQNVRAPGNSVMDLTGIVGQSNDPNLCPGIPAPGWQQAHYRDTSVIGEEKIRTCFRTDRTCQVMDLTGIVGQTLDPPLCSSIPGGGWLEANYRNTAFIGSETIRTCFRCN